MRFVSLLLTTEQAELLAAAARDAETQLNEYAATAEEDDPAGEDALQYGRLGMLLQDAAERPLKYTPTGKQATVTRGIVRRVKGAAQPQSRRNKRKARQEERIRTHKERRRFRKQIAEAYNASREKLEAEREAQEAERAALEARIEGQPKYAVVTADGQTILTGIPAEFIVNEAGENLAPKLIVPGA